MIMNRRRYPLYPRAGARRRPVAPRRGASVASTLGTAAGTAAALLLAAMLGGLSWWGGVLIILVGLAVGALWSMRRTQGIAVPEGPHPA